MRVSWVSLETTPYLSLSTALRMELLLGVWNSPVPALCSINIEIIKTNGELSVSVAPRSNHAMAERH